MKESHSYTRDRSCLVYSTLSLPGNRAVVEVLWSVLSPTVLTFRVRITHGTNLLSMYFVRKDLIKSGHGGGIVVSILAYCSDVRSSNPAGF